MLKSLIILFFGLLASSLIITILLPVYTGLFLYYKTLILNFLFEIFADKDSKEVSIILQETKRNLQPAEQLAADRRRPNLFPSSMIIIFPSLLIIDNK